MIDKDIIFNNFSEFTLFTYNFIKNRLTEKVINDFKEINSSEKNIELLFEEANFFNMLGIENKTLKVRTKTIDEKKVPQSVVDFLKENLSLSVKQFSAAK